ncbi:hypothetical protein CRV08_08980 [Halarcobacter ebronensis]|uniref:Response regulatory domain-containing protein n=1 Tax=Halarcobacter ebronensis TaxID=1462615 RepID=A0A4Q0YFY2_9BACT|nr:response regulator [Halarcobacter ebronensis]RXJ67939.1 hypothetical protein CRV08_08980 [Halarcobacter ebronensis]
MNESFLKNITILIAEDNEDDLQILVSTLKKYFNKIFTASNGLEALKIYRENQDIDIIISKIQMEKMNGIDLLKSIRFTNLYIPFIIISAKIDNDILLEAINLNISSYILKPIDIKTLLEKIDILCEKKYFEFRFERKQEELNNYISSVDKVAVVFKLKRDGTITYMNDSMCEISGYNKEEIGKLNFNDIIHPDIPKMYIEDSWSKIEKGNIWRGNTKFISKKNEVFYLNSSIFKNSEGEDEYTTVAFLTTKENLEKRDFHRKVLLSIKEFNLREHRYKEEIRALREELAAINITSYESKLVSLKQKMANCEAQLKSYENRLDEDEKKYKAMLETKKLEINKYVDLIQVEKVKNQKNEEEKRKFIEEMEIVKAINEKQEDEIKKLTRKVEEMRKEIWKS